MEVIAQLSVSQLIVIGIIILLVFITVLYFLKNIKFKKGDMELNVVKKEDKVSVDEIDRIIHQLETDMKNRYYGYISSQKRVFASYFPNIVPIEWKFIIAECITNSLMSAIMRNHLEEKFTDKEVFATWMTILDKDAIDDLQAYIANGHQGTAQWVNWLYREEFASIIQDIRRDTYTRMRQFFLEYLRNCINTISVMSNLDEKSKSKITELQKVLKKTKEDWVWLKPLLERV